MAAASGSEGRAQEKAEARALVDGQGERGSGDRERVAGQLHEDKIGGQLCRRRMEAAYVVVGRGVQTITPMFHRTAVRSNPCRQGNRADAVIYNTPLTAHWRRRCTVLRDDG